MLDWIVPVCMLVPVLEKNYTVVSRNRSGRLQVKIIKRIIWKFYFLTFVRLPETIVVFSRMILRLKNPVLIPGSEVNITIPRNVSM